MMYFFWLGEDAEDIHDLELVWDEEERSGDYFEWEGYFV